MPGRRSSWLSAVQLFSAAVRVEVDGLLQELVGDAWNFVGAYVALLGQQVRVTREITVMSRGTGIRIRLPWLWEVYEDFLREP